MFRSAFSASLLIVAGTFGSFVASAICTLTSPFSMETDFTRPNETISRVKPGYFTDFKALFTCSSEIVMRETYAHGRGGKPRHSLDRLVLKPMAIAEGQFSHGVAQAEIPGGRARVTNALKTTRSTYDLSVLIIHFVANLILVAPREAGGLFSAFRYKVRVLPVRPRAVFRPHWVRRQFEPENSVCVTGKF
jgi:hypothetical protein